MTAALIIGTSRGPTFHASDEGLALARDLLGDGSDAYIAVQAMMVENVAARVFASDQEGWLSDVGIFSVLHPVLGALVRRRVLDRMVRLAFEPLGEWLEKKWPWLFEEPIDGDDAFAREAA